MYNSNAKKSDFNFPWLVWISLDQLSQLKDSKRIQRMKTKNGSYVF